MTRKARLCGFPGFKGGEPVRRYLGDNLIAVIGLHGGFVGIVRGSHLVIEDRVAIAARGGPVVHGRSQLRPILAISKLAADLQVLGIERGL